jgi:hypothetical protein
MYHFPILPALEGQRKLALIRYIIMTKDLNPTIIYSRAKVYTTCFVETNTFLKYLDWVMTKSFVPHSRNALCAII